MPRSSILSDALAMRRVMRDYRRTRTELAPHVDRRLRNVLLAAHRHVPFYRESMKALGYDPARDYAGVQDLARLPVITRSMLREHGERAFVREGADLSRYFKDATSGSTGQPLRVWRDPAARSLQVARWLRVLMVNGYRFTDRVLAFTAPARLAEGRSPLQKFGLLRRQTIPFSVSPKEMLEALMSHRPDVVYGNRSQIDLLAMELIARACPPPPLKFIVVGAEVIREHHRRLYERAFRTRVVECYGSVELGIIAFETLGSQGLRICEDQLYCEFLNERNEPASVGEPCRIVATDLANRLMPFIRYEQGDWLELKAADVAQGDDWRRIHEIKGRDDDYAVLPDGTKVAFHSFYELLYGYQDVNQFRIVQTRADAFEIVMAARPEHIDAIRDELLGRLRERFPAGIKFGVRRVDRIEPDPTGKLRRLVSDLSS